MGYTSYTSFMVVVTGFTHNGDHWADGSILDSFSKVPETMVTLDCFMVFHGWSNTSKTWSIAPRVWAGKINNQ